MYLHSTMVLFKCKRRIYEWLGYRIYIPLWSYSNELLGKDTVEKLIFTFHYGPIQIEIGEYLALGLYKFTFHYGPIQIERTESSNPNINIYIPLWSYSNHQRIHRHNPCYTYLHSTMVLFKFDLHISSTLISSFTFHYGPIQILAQCRLNLT